MSCSAPTSLRFNGHGTASTSARRVLTVTKLDQTDKGIPLVAGFNGHGTASTSASVLPDHGGGAGRDGGRADVFQWPRNGQHLCKAWYRYYYRHLSVKVSMATERPAPLQASGLCHQSFQKPASFQWPRNGQHLCKSGNSGDKARPVGGARFNGHGTASTSARSRPSSFGSHKWTPSVWFQWPRNGQHLCKG